MKKLFLFAFLLISLAASAQIPHPGYAPKVFSYGNAFNRAAFDSALHFPNKPCLCTLDNDTTPQIFVFMDSLRFFWNGNYWNFGHGGGTGGGTYTADETSLHLSGTTFSIKTSWTGQNTISILGTITSGIWNSTAIADAYIASSATWNAKQTSVLTSAKIWVGNGSNVAAEQTPSGDLTINNSGVFTLASTLTAGTCTNCNLTYDAKGRITVATNGTGGGSGNPFADNTALIKNNADNTRQAILSAASIPTGTTLTYTLPAAGGTFTLDGNTSTLTNKTISGSSNTLSNIGNGSLTNSTISGVSLGSNLFSLTNGVAMLPFTYNGSSAKVAGVDTATLYGFHPSYFVNGLSVGTVSSDSFYLGGNPLIRNTSLSGSNAFSLSFDSMKLYYRPVASTIQNLDTTNRKLLTWNPTTKQIDVSYWQVPGTGGGSSTNVVGIDTVTTIISGASSTVPNGTNVIRFNNTSPLTYTLTLPTTWHTSNNLLIAFTANGTITNGNAMVTLTIVNGSGHTLSQSVNPNGITYVAGEVLEYHLISTIEQRVN